MPLGPSDVRRILETALAAWMLLFTASIPLTRDLVSCSCRQGRRGDWKAEQRRWAPIKSRSEGHAAHTAALTRHRAL